MAPEKAPAFQFYPKEFITDGNVAGMSLQERGAYITLLCLCWQERTLPIDTARLANMVGVPKASFKNIWPALSMCFVERDGRYIHPRLEKEREKQELFRRRQSEKGKASAANRASTTAQPKSNHGPTGAQPEPQPKVNSPISDLRTTLKENTHTPARGTLFGNEHRAHAHCDRVCVPAFLHREFRLALGGDESAADTRLRDWYASVLSEIPEDEPVESDGLKFWRPRFTLAFVKPKDIKRSEQEEADLLWKEIQRQEEIVKRR